MSARGELLRRIVREHRAVVIPLAIVLLANLIVYAAIVYPLERRVSSVTERTRAAEVELAAARAQFEQAAGMQTGRSQATEDLERFYTEVLPASFSDARRLVFPRLGQLASQVGLEIIGRSTDFETDPERTLTRVTFQVTLEGSYGAIRRFVHQMEHASEFLVIDQMTLAEDATEEGLLSVQLQLSTYFRAGEPEAEPR